MNMMNNNERPCQRFVQFSIEKIRFHCLSTLGQDLEMKNTADRKIRRHI